MPATHPPAGDPLEDLIDLTDINRILSPPATQAHSELASASVVLVILAAGKGTRFGTRPKCVQPVRRKPLARHAIDAFRSLVPAPSICVVGYAREEVIQALGADNIYVQTSNPAGGTALAAYEALAVPGLMETNPLVIITMGDRIVPDSIFQRILDLHRDGAGEADLTLLSSFYVPPAQHGKGRIVRDANGRILRILEQRDIDEVTDPAERNRLNELVEGNCPLYAVRARTLRRFLGPIRNNNAQGQYYLTDLVEAISRSGGEVRSLSTCGTDPEYLLLCSDVTRPADLARLESLLQNSGGDCTEEEDAVRAAAEALAADRSMEQTAAIAHQLRDLLDTVDREEAGFRASDPVAVGISGGRFRIAFMHPDMARFYGPAWQMPTGAAHAEGLEQIVLLAQPAQDGKIHHLSTHPEFREKVSAVSADDPGMYPSEDVDDVYKYEEFGTRMAEQVLLSLGYFSDQEIQARREAGIPLPPASLWVGNSMRRPFSLICNAIASLRTLRHGPTGDRVRRHLGRDEFRGLRVITTGSIPRGGFSSSSALTVAIKNALNVLYSLGIPTDTLIHLACQAEYGTGVRAGSLDQATEQKGILGQGTLVSSNPKDNYRMIGTYPVPSERIRFIFPYSVDRDREAWKWSSGVYAGDPHALEPTTTEMRKLTGKAAELSARFCGLPPEQDFFPLMEEELVRDGRLGDASLRTVTGYLRRVPLLVSKEEIRDRLAAKDAALDHLLAGWRDPFLRRSREDGSVVEETGVPLRAMLAYLFVEVARNFRLLHDPGHWIEWVTRSQRGDCSVDIDPARLPDSSELLREQTWERGLLGPDRLNEWLRKVNAVPFNYNQDLDNASLDALPMKPLHEIRGGSFFRGLALLDLAEAMLNRAFGDDAVAIRVNAAGQGDYFQVHVDTTRTDPEAVKDFIRNAFYKRFGLSPKPPFVEPHPGGGAIGVRLDRFGLLPRLVETLFSLKPRR